MHVLHDEFVEKMLRWFLVLAEAENVTDAAAELGMSQPALSRRLAALEKALGSPLFERPGRRLVLNDAGRIYVDAATRADFTLTVAAERIAELNARATPTLRLGFLHSFGGWLVPQLLTRVEAHHPGLRHLLVQDAADTIGHLVVSGDVDIAVVSPRPALGGALAWRPLTRQPIGLGVPQGHALARRSHVTLSDVADEVFVTMPPRYGMRKILDDACAGVGLNPRIGTECQELGTVAGLVAAGLGVALLPLGPQAPEPAGVRVIALDQPALTRDIGLIWAKARTLPGPARTLRDLPW